MWSKSRVLKQLALLVFAVLFFLGSSALAEEQKKDEENKPEKPFKNAVFHDTYMVKDESFVSPRTHPYLFSFSGRWLRRRNVYQASAWPGTSMTALIYGQTCKLKIKSYAKTGIVKNHHILASVDNGPQVLLALPDYNATENQVFDVNIELPALDKNLEEASNDKQVLVPHVVELTSEPGSPLYVVGFTIDNMLVNQGRDWLKKQDLIPSVEYISDKLDGALVLNQSSVYRVARQLGLRQEYVVDYNVCFSGECSRKQAGLSEEYSFFSPFHGNPRPQDAREPMPNRYVFHRDDPMMQVKEPEFVVVDVGDNDLEKQVDGLEFMNSLQHFLGNLILNARPNAEIFVLIRNGRYVTETEDAIVSMRHSKLHAVKFGTDTPEWYKSFYCSYILPLSDDSYPYRELCGSAYEQLTAGSGVDASAFIHGLLIVGFLVGIVYAFYSKRRAIAGYINDVKGYGKIPLAESS